MDFQIDNRILGIPVVQNQQEFVVGVFSISQILKFTKYTKRIIRGFDEEGLPIYNDQIQREIESSRVDSISEFLIRDPEATFPTNLVLHIPEEIILGQKNENGVLIIEIDEKVFVEVQKEKYMPSTGDVFISIIDGQHRVKGIEEAIKKLNEHIKSLQKTLANSINKNIQDKLEYYQNRLTDLLNIQLVVTFFFGKPIEYQAMIFSTINRTQKRVSESLVYSLFGLTVDDTPQKTSLQISLALNAHKNSPFYNRIKLYGGDYGRNLNPPLSQATMVKSIVALISESAKEAELDRYRKRKELLIRRSNKRLPFRLYYANNNDDKISDILFHYFNAVREVFMIDDKNSLWDFDPTNMKPMNILHTTVGYLALLEILVELLEIVSEKDRYSTKSYTSIIHGINKLNVSDQSRYPFTSKSKTIFFLDLAIIVFPNSINKNLWSDRLNEILLT
jgi:DGQHR domain-containing protein